MRMQSIIGTKALIALPIIIVCMSLCGCSSVKNFVGFFNFWDSDKSTIGTTSQADEGSTLQVRAPRRNVEAYYNLGCYYQERDRHREAIQEFQKAVSIDPTHVKALNRMGISYDEVKDFPRAVASYEAAIKADANADYTYNNLAHSYRLQGRFQESVDTFKKALAINSQSSRIHNNLGLVYTIMGQHELATKEFEQAIVLAKPAAPIEQAQDKQEASTPRTTTVKENPKPSEDPFTQAELVQPNSTPVVQRERVVTEIAAPRKKTEPATVVLNTSAASKAPAGPGPVASLARKEGQSVAAAANTGLTAKTPAKSIPVVSIPEPTSKAPVVIKTAEVRKPAVQPKDVVKAKTGEAVNLAKAIEFARVPRVEKATVGTNVAEVTGAPDAKKTAELKKVIEPKKVAATPNVATNRPVSQPRSMSLVLSGKATVSTVKPQGLDLANPERFYARIARSIVRATPENLVPKRMVTSDRRVMNVNLLLRKDMMPSTKLLLEDYT